MKRFLFLTLVLVAVAPLSAHAQGYCDTSGNALSRFLWPCGTGPGAMKEVLTVHSWGPTVSPSYHTNSGDPYQVSYPQMPQLGTSYQYPSYQPSYQYPSYQPMYQPSYYQQPQYYQPQYYPQYSYPQSSYYPYSQGGLYQPTVMPPSPTQLAGITPQPVGGHDIWGDPLCSWGSGYYGYSCYQDPHQWIFDPYTGQWY